MRRPKISSCPLGLAAAVPLVAAHLAAGAVITSTWIGPVEGGWTTAVNWDPQVIPNNDFDTYVAVLPAGTSNLIYTATVTVDRIVLGPGASVTVTDGASDALVPATLQLHSSPSQNDGVIGLPGLNAVTMLRLNGDAAINGSGEVVMGPGTQAVIQGFGAVRTLTNGAGHTIRGVGSIGTNGLLSLVNNGTVRCTGTNGMIIQLAGTQADNRNSGVLRAEAGFLTLSTCAIDNTGGTIAAADGAGLILAASHISGGSIQVAPAAFALLVAMGTLDGVSIEGQLQAPTGTLVNIADTISVQGVLLVLGGGAPTMLMLTGDSTITGGGAIDLSGTGTAQITATSPRVLTIDTGTTIRGRGTIGGGNVALVNHGTIRALGGTLTIAEAVIDNSGGLILAPPGAEISLDGCSLSGGVVQVDGALAVNGGPLDLTSGVLTGGGTINGDVVNHGGSIIPGTAADPLVINGSLDQEAGTLTIQIDGSAGSGNYGRLTVSGDVTLGGTLVVDVAPGFTPDPADVYTIVSDNSASGLFASISSCAPVDLTYFAHGVELQFTGGANSPDINGDGIVNGADLGLLLAHWGPCGSGCCDQDLNGDDVVDGADLGILLAHWGT